jgi:hypothetical protein
VQQGEGLLCLLIKATRDSSAFHTTYLTGGLLTSEMNFCCWMLYKTAEEVELKMRLPVPP